MTEVVLAEGVRTGRGKGSPRGALHGAPPLTLVSQLLRELEARGLPAALVEDVLLGCATQTGDQGTNLARTAVLDAGWPPAVAGLMVNRFCASGLEAVSLAYARVRAGDAELLVAGGVESVSRVPAFSDGGPLYGDAALGARLGAVHMGVAADLIATLDGASRDQLDDYAEASRAKARAAHAAGAFARSLVPVAGLAHDELLDGAPDRQALRALPPAFAARPAEAALALARYPHAAPLAHLHTKGNSPALADAAALLVVGERGAVERAGLVPRARLVATASCAAEPVIMLTAGQLALERALARANLVPRQLEAVMFAEAFAAVCLRLARQLGLAPEQLNPNGGTLALGHAFGATGAILLIDALDTLEVRRARHAAVAVSGAAGLGAALVLERLP